MNELSKEKTMTIKEIATFLKVDYSHVYRITKKLFPEKFANGKTTYLNENNVNILSEYLKVKVKNAPLQNAKQNEKALTKQDLIEYTRDIVKECVNETLKQIIPLIQNNSQQQVGYNKPKQVEYVPKMSLRQKIVKNVREYSTKVYGNYYDGFNELYKNVYYQLHINLGVRAREFNLKIIEYIENYLDESIQNKILYISENMLKGVK
jgi:DNA-binding Lrp family transcriptional regulator